MAQSTDDYEFEMFDLRKRLLAGIAECVREGDFHKAKTEAKHIIRLNAEGNGEAVDKQVKAFATSFDKARELVEEGGDTNLEIADMPPILEDHDGEIEGDEIVGDAVELVRSVDRSGFGDPETSLYPVVDHPSGYRVCTCPSQKYHLVCKHTLARIIERDWEDAPVPA